MKKTQKQIVLDRLKRQGSVNNVACFQGVYGRPILRLGALIHKLRQEGYEIETLYKNKKGFRNTVYKLKK